MAPMFVTCPECACAAKVSESACPHCGVLLRRADGSIGRTAAAVLLGLASVAVACGDDTTGAGGAGGGGGSTADGGAAPEYGVPGVGGSGGSTADGGSTSDGGAAAEYGVPGVGGFAGGGNQ